MSQQIRNREELPQLDEKHYKTSAVNIILTGEKLNGSN